MAIKDDIKENFRNKVEESTGIIGQAMREKRRKLERQQEVQKEVAEIQQNTSRIKTAGSYLTKLEVSFLQISKNIQLMAKALNAQVTLQEETNKSLQSTTTTSPELNKQTSKQSQLVDKTDDKENESLLDKIGNLVDMFEKKTKGKKPRGKETPKEKAKRAKVEEKTKTKETKQRAKVEDKATAAKKAAEGEAKAAGKGAKEVSKAGQKAAKQVVKKASQAAVKAAARKAILKSIGKMAAKSIPYVGAAAGLGFAIERLLAGDPVGAGIEAVGGLGSALTSIPATILNTTRDVYYEMYGVYPEQDDSPDKAERYAEVYKVVKEEVEAALKNAVFAKPEAPAGMEFDAEGNVISSPAQQAIKKAPPPPPPPPPPKPAPPPPKPAPEPVKQPSPSAAPTPAPSAPVPARPTEAQIRSSAKDKVAAAVQPTGLVGSIMTSLSEAGIKSTKAIANILATIKAETGFKVRSENINYNSAERIQAIFGKKRIPSLEYAQQFVNNPEGLANEVYKKTDGNSAPGDGYKYRGRGFIQHTGKNQYEGIKKFTGIDVVGNPDLLNDPVVATKALAWFFLVYKGKKPAQLESMSEVNKAVGFADTTGKEAEHRIASAEQISSSIDSGQSLDSLSTSVADSKRAKKKSGDTVVVNNNTTVQNGGGAQKAPQSQVTRTVGA